MPLQGLAALTQGRGVLLQRLQQGCWQAAAGGLEPAHVVAGGQGLEAGLQGGEQVPLHCIRLLPELLGQLGDRAVVAVGGAQFDGGCPQQAESLRPAELFQ